MERRRLSYEALLEYNRELMIDLELQGELIEQMAKASKELVVAGERALRSAGYQRFGDVFLKVRRP